MAAQVVVTTSSVLWVVQDVVSKPCLELAAKRGPKQPSKTFSTTDPSKQRRLNKHKVAYNPDEFNVFKCFLVIPTGLLPNCHNACKGFFLSASLFGTVKMALLTTSRGFLQMKTITCKIARAIGGTASPRQAVTKFFHGTLAVGDLWDRSSIPCSMRLRSLIWF
jgi:hypothetical protein